MEEVLAFVAWLIDEQGVDVNCHHHWVGLNAPLYNACSPELVSALMDRGTDPGPTSSTDWTALICHAADRRPACVARLLEYPAVRATVNVQVGRRGGWTALHVVCGMYGDDEARDAMIAMLLAAGANTTIRDERRKLARDKLLQYGSEGAAPALAFFEEADDSRRAEMLVLARRRWVASHGSRPME